MNQPGRLRKTWEEHRQLVEAIASHNATQARKLARIHMEHSEQTLLQGMEESPEFTKAIYILYIVTYLYSNKMIIIRTTRKTGGLLTGYKPVVLGQRLKALAFTTFKPHSH